MSNKDHKGRPIVVVTGVGVVSSLGTGKQENWEKLTKGQSGIHRIERFANEGLRTTIAGTVDFMDLETHSAPELSLALARSAAEEAVEECGIEKGDFPGPLFLAVPPVETEWQHRFELDGELPTDGEDSNGYGHLLKAARANRHQAMYELLQFNRTADHLSDEFGTKGLPVSLSTACASGATAVQLGVEAIRRGDSEAGLARAADAQQ